MGKIDEADSISLGGVDFESYFEQKKDVESHPNENNLAESCFEHFFQHAKGHAKLIDEQYSSLRPNCYSSVKH